MVKHSVLIIGLLILLVLLAATTLSQEVTITGFPAGVAGDIDPELFESYHQELQAIADTLQKYPQALAVVTGGADGLRFHRYNNALNPGIALGRAHALRNYLINELQVDSTQIVIQSADTKISGDKYRYASVRITMDWVNQEFPAYVHREQAPETTFVHIEQAPETTVVAGEFFEYVGFQFGAGLSTSPFGVIPVLTGALTWNRMIYVEAIVGYTVWEDSYLFGSTNLDTKNRIAGGMLCVFPSRDLPVGVVGGWIRTEEISQSFYKYVRLSEGPMIGLRATPIEHLSVTGVFNPSKHRNSGNVFSISKDDQFLLYATLHLTFGGAK